MAFDLFRRLYARGRNGVCADEDVGADEVLELLSSLVDKSLVVADLEGIAPRYRLLESFREYAREKLKAGGQEIRCRSGTRWRI